MVVRKIPDRKKTPWQLDCGYLEVEGRRKRVQLYFEKKDEAEQEMRNRQAKVKQHGVSALSISEDTRIRYHTIERRLAELGATIEEAVSFFERHRHRVSERLTLGELMRRGTEAAETHLDTGYMSSLRVAWRSFLLGREDVPVDDLTSAVVKGWLESHGWVLKTQRNYLDALSWLFRWAMQSDVRLAGMNPCLDVVLPKRSKHGGNADGAGSHDEDDEEEITCMTLDQARAFLGAARAVAARNLWYFALAMFTGLRAKELRGLRRDDIMVDQELVRVRKAVAKGGMAGRTRRVIPLSANCVAWLREWMRLAPAEEGAPLFKLWQLRLDFNAVRRAAGWKIEYAHREKRLVDATGAEIPLTGAEWPRNVTRHTFASMHFAKHEDEVKLKVMMGHHKSPAVLRQQYLAVEMLDGTIITPGIGAEFWELLPETPR